jgi:hemolysin activation/secretion protein
LRRPSRRASLFAAALLTGCVAPGVLFAQVAAPDMSQGRTGPAPLPRPAYVQPPTGLPAPPVPGPAAAVSEGGGYLTEIRVALEGPAGEARPPRGWRPPDEAGANLRLEPGQNLDLTWVRRQFALNGMPGAGASVGRALALVQLINRAYLAAGFLNSGVVVRPSPSTGVLELAVIYGGLAPPAAGQPAISVEWAGDKSRGLNLAYLRNRLPSAQGRPLSGADLERDFRLLAEDPAIRTLNADLRPGSRPGEASLALGVYPQDRFDLYATVANNRSPSVGGERASLGGSMRNLLAAGDLLSGEAGRTRGLDDLAAGYAAPFLSPKTTLSIRAALNNAAVVSAPLTALDITARDRSGEIGLTRRFVDVPLLPRADAAGWTPARTLTGGVLVTRRVSRTFLQGLPFSFSPGSVGGRTQYTALRLTGDYLVRSVDQVFAVSVTATRGLEGSGSDLPGLPAPKQGFDVLLAQVNYARRLSAKGLEVRARLSGQLTDSVLYSGERFSAGGETTVRGYRENLVLADEGLVGSMELGRPFRLGRPQNGGGFDWGAFAVTGFVDAAALRNVHPPQPERKLASLGASLAWTPSDALAAQLTYGFALTTPPSTGAKDIQDRGVTFRVTVRPLRLGR